MDKGKEEVDFFGGNTELRDVYDNEIQAETDQLAILKELLLKDADAKNAPAEISIYSEAHQTGIKKHKYCDAHDHRTIAFDLLNSDERKSILKEAVEKTHADVSEQLGSQFDPDSELPLDERSGATLILTAVSINDTFSASGRLEKRIALFTTASLGDSSAYVMLRDKKTGLVTYTTRLNRYLHSPTDPDELERLQNIDPKAVFVQNGHPKIGKSESSVTAGFGISRDKDLIRREAQISVKGISYDPEKQELIFISGSDGLTEKISGKHEPVDSLYLEHMVNQYSQEKPGMTLGDYLLMKANERIKDLKPKTGDDTTVMVANLTDSTNAPQLFCLCDGSGLHGDKVAQVAVSSVVKNSLELTQQRVITKKIQEQKFSEVEKTKALDAMQLEPQDFETPFDFKLRIVNGWLNTDEFISRFKQEAILLDALKEFDSGVGPAEHFKEFEDELTPFLEIMCEHSSNPDEFNPGFTLKKAKDQLEKQLKENPNSLLLQGLDTAVSRNLAALVGDATIKSSTDDALSQLHEQLEFYLNEIKSELNEPIQIQTNDRAFYQLKTKGVDSFELKSTELTKLSEGFDNAMKKLQSHEMNHCANSSTLKSAKQDIIQELNKVSRTIAMKNFVSSFRKTIYEIGSRISIREEARNYYKSRAEYVEQKSGRMLQLREDIKAVKDEIAPETKKPFKR
jgi:serine/threonine protein phosphatase PrpC